MVTGVFRSHRKVNGIMTVVEYVRDESGKAYFRVRDGRFKGKWTFDGTSSVEAPSYKGGTWMTGPGLLSLYAKVRLPK